MNTNTNFNIETTPKLYGKLIGVFIDDPRRKHKKALKALKEFLDGTAHITKYCNNFAHTPNIKPENIYIFPYSTGLCDLLDTIIHGYDYSNREHFISAYISLFSIYSKTPSIKYSNNLGYISIDKENIDVITE